MRSIEGMAEWRSRAEIHGDVVFFSYRKEEQQLRSSEVYVWDLDKTYLDTSWATLGEIWRLALEKAFQKRNVPGTATLVAALKASWEKERSEESFPIFFITASPPQMETRIREKLELDEILPMGMFFKDNLRNLKPKRMWRLTQQVGYKIQSLLQLRASIHQPLRQVLWGDDSESDAIIYSLYSDICARRWSEAELRNILKGLRVIGEQTDVILELQDQIPAEDPVEKIYINLATDTDPEYYLKFGRRLIPTYNTFQTALDLWQDGRLGPEQVVRVGHDMIMNYGFSPDQLEVAFDDLVRRKILSAQSVETFSPVLKDANFMDPEYEPSVPPAKVLKQIQERVFQLDGEHEPWIQERIDYLHDYR